jgi:SAM-dependent methyltransferase
VASEPIAIDWYDLPRLYDVVFDVGTRQEADFLEGAARAYGRTESRRALEPACGTGRLVAELARRGWTVRGFDRNRKMLAYARRRLESAGRKASLAVGDMARFDVAQRYDLAHCLVSTFKYLLDEDSARSHLECVARALEPGGVYVLGLHLSDYDRVADERERWVERRGGSTVTSDMRIGPPDRRTRLEAVRNRLTEKTAREERHYESRWDFRTYSAREVESLLRSVPALELVAVHDFDYLLERPRKLRDDRLDKVLVLKRV